MDCPLLREAIHKRRAFRRRQIIRLVWSGHRDFLRNRGGGSGLSSGVFVGCLSRDAWDWGHCSSIVSSGPAGHCHRGPSSPWPEHPLYFSHSMALRKDIKDQRDVLFRFVWGLILNTWFPGPNFGTFNLFCSA